MLILAQEFPATILDQMPRVAKIVAERDFRGMQPGQSPHACFTRYQGKEEEKVWGKGGY